MNPSIDSEEEVRKGNLRAVFSFVAALAILAGAAGLSVWMIVSRVKTEPEDADRPVPTVDAVALQAGRHVVQLTSEGVVRSTREVALAAEVSGRITSISPQLIEGGTFAENDVLATIGDADYQAALRRAESSVAEAQLTIEQEKARATQAERDWAKLGRGEAPALVLRKPQIAAAEARLASALAEVDRARNDIARTTIKAPFSGRVRRAQVEVGAFVNPGTPIAEIFSDQSVEVRLPFSLADYALSLGDKTPPFTISAEYGGETRTWPAVLDRTGGEIDRETLSGYAIARIEQSPEFGYPPVGLFVRAQLTGKTIADAVEIPRAALRGAHDVWVIADGVLAKRTAQVVRSGRDSLIVTGDFAPGDLLVTTRLSAPVPGMQLKARSDEPNK